MTVLEARKGKRQPRQRRHCAQHLKHRIQTAQRPRDTDEHPLAEGALAQSSADLALAVTGVAGPNGGSPGKPVGLVHLAAARRTGRTLHRAMRFGDLGRTEVRRRSVLAAFALLAWLLAAVLALPAVAGAEEPASGQTGDAIGATMAAEFSLRAGKLNEAVRWYLQASDEVGGDAALVERAVQVALVDTDDALLGQALDRWRELAPPTLAMRSAQATWLLRNIPGLPPILQTIHLLSVSAVMGSIVFINLRVLGIAFRRQQLSEMLDRLMPWLWGALLTLLLSGLPFILARPGRYFENPVFLIKFSLLIPAIVLTLIFVFRLRGSHAAPDVAADGPALQGIAARSLACLSLLLWLGIVMAGRWIAYSDYLFYPA